MNRHRLAASVLGEPEIFFDGVSIDLPQSRKSRALLFYLALTARPHRRERLCEIFFEEPADPRAALRWSLTKIRSVVDGDRTRLRADGERVSLETDDFDIDLAAIRRRLLDPAGDPSPGELADMAGRLELPLLDGLDLPRSQLFSAWLAAERAAAEELFHAVLRRLGAHPALSAEEQLKWARRWHLELPHEEAAATALIAVLKKNGRGDEVPAVLSAYRAAAAAAGLPAGDPAPETGRPVALQPPASAASGQSIAFCTTPDGFRLAWATAGNGVPVLKAASWLNHLELDWASPVWGDTFAALAGTRRLIRYDGRGEGLSDRDVGEIGFGHFVTDLEAVADAAAPGRFPLLGFSYGAAVAVEYALRHPDRVSALVLVGGIATGWCVEVTAEQLERRNAVLTLTRHQWGKGNAAYRRIFSQSLMPDATGEELDWFDEFQRLAISPENAVRYQEAMAEFDLRSRLAAVAVPTLVVHSRDDLRVPLEHGRELAAAIPGARFVALPSRNHIVVSREPAWPVMMAEIEAFLADVERNGR